MTAHVETIAYRSEGGVPWHGIGTPVSNNMSVEEMLQASGLEWNVLKQPLYFLTPAKDGEKPRVKLVPDEFALVRDTDEVVLDTVGANFKPIQNAEIFDFFKRFVEAGDMTMETAGSLKGGRFIWALARINESFNLGKGDETRGYVLLSQPHQFGYSMTAALTPVRVVCWNTISAALGSSLDGSGGSNSASFRMVHSRAFDDGVKAQAEIALGLAHDGMKAYHHTAELLSGVAYNDNSLTDYFRGVLQLEKPEDDTEQAKAEADEEENRTMRRFREALTSAPGQELFKGTWWSPYNAITWTVDHQMGRTDDNRLFSAWYGKGASTKRRALELAVDYAKAA